MWLCVVLIVIPNPDTYLLLNSIMVLFNIKSTEELLLSTQGATISNTPICTIWELLKSTASSASEKV